MSEVITRMHEGCATPKSEAKNVGAVGGVSLQIGCLCRTVVIVARAHREIGVGLIVVVVSDSQVRQGVIWIPSGYLRPLPPGTPSIDDVELGGGEEVVAATPASNRVVEFPVDV